MNFPTVLRLDWPVVPYRVTADGWRFGEWVRRRIVYWAVHLGDDVVLPAGTPVRAIGTGTVVFARTLPGSEQKRSWGGVVIVRHGKNDHIPITDGQLTNEFYSLYGHLAGLAVREGEAVLLGQQLGVIAAGRTPENGWWKVAHLHFGIYSGPWRGQALPGYWRPERWWRTRRRWWHDPQTFIAAHSASA